MAALCRLASVVMTAVEPIARSEPGPADAVAAARRFTERVEMDARAIARQAAALLDPDDIVVTVSASSLVERALIGTLRTGGPKIICLESRPACEGVALAERLASAGLHVTVVSDAAGPSSVERARVVLLGADTLAPTGLVHKVGTLSLVLAARHFGAFVYTLCGDEKLMPAPLRGALSDGGPPEQVVATAPPGVSVVNPFFDLTPLPLLDAVVGASGIRTPAAAAGAARRVTVHPALIDLLDS
jgi:translation initiation factor 2B subunit (eIF-2B alpha/beta/delta family)